VEETITARTDQVLHRTINLEERKPEPAAVATGSSSDVIRRRRIEIWQSAEKGITARRLYDEKGRLIAGDWRRADGVQILYHHGRRPQLQLAPEKRARTPLSFDDVWQVDTSAKEFARLIENTAAAHVEELPAAYLISYESGSATGLVKAKLVLSRADLHAVEQILDVRQGSEVRQYAFKEATFERHSPSTVAPAVFEPEPQLLGADTVTRKPGDAATIASLLPNVPPSIVATAELEVEVLRLLNQAGADYGEQISISRTPGGQLKIEGVVEDSKRKSEVLRALAPVATNPAVHIQVVAADEARQRQPSRAQSEPVTLQQVEPTSTRIPVDAELRRFFTARGITGEKADHEIARFSDRTLARSRQAMIHAHALRNLVQRFSAESLRTLNLEARAKWLTLLRGHAQALSRDLRTQRQELEAVFNPPPLDEGYVPVITDDASLLRTVERLFELSAARDRALSSAFAISSDASTSSALDSPQFWRSFKQAQTLTERIAAFGP